MDPIELKRVEKAALYAGKALKTKRFLPASIFAWRMVSLMFWM
jgi:hypothetical protein